MTTQTELINPANPANPAIFSPISNREKRSERIAATMSQLSYTQYPVFKSHIVITDNDDVRLIKDILADSRYTLWSNGPGAKTRQKQLLQPLPEELTVVIEDKVVPNPYLVTDLKNIKHLMLGHWIEQFCREDLSMCSKISLLADLMLIPKRKSQVHSLEFLGTTWDFRNLTIKTKTKTMEVLKLGFMGGKILYGDKLMLLTLMSLAKSCHTTDELNYRLNYLTNLFKVEDNYGATAKPDYCLFQIREHHLALIDVSSGTPANYPYFQLSNQSGSILDAVSAITLKGWAVTTDKYGIDHVLYGPGAEAMCQRHVTFQGANKSASLSDVTNPAKRLNRGPQFFASSFADTNPYCGEVLERGALTIALSVIDYSRESYTSKKPSI